MQEKETEGIFKDFNFTDDSSKHGIKKSLEKQFDKYKLEEVKNKEEIESLKEELKSLNERVNRPDSKPKADDGNGRTGPSGIERIFLIGIIIILLGFMIYHLVYQDGIPQEKMPEDTVEAVLEINDSATTDSNTTKDYPPEANLTANESLANETSAHEADVNALSGEVALLLGDIEFSVDENDDSIGYINQVNFRIDNQRNTTLKPLVNVYIYDDNTKDPWEKKSRGVYRFESGIKPGEAKAGYIDVSPKTFRELGLPKHLRIVLNSTTDKLLDYATKEVYIY